MDSLLLGACSKSSALPFSAPSRLFTFRKDSQGAVQFTKCGAWNTIDIGRVRGYFTHYHVNSIGERRPVYQRHVRKYLRSAASEHPLESEPEAYNPKISSNSIRTTLGAFYRFSRPHTVIGTAMSIVSVSLLAVKSISDFSPFFVVGLLEAIFAALFMNVYIVGLNQIYDIEIDKVNKPYLPLASGEYSVHTGVIIVTSFAIMSFWLGWIVGSWPLFWALFISFILGTAYSINLPLLRWKRFALVAAMCILAVRAVIVQIAFFLHMQTYVFRRPAILTRPLIFATAFMSFFSVVIALFKDIPDIDGDKIFGIQSFSVRLGQKRVFWICICLLEMAYGVAVLMGAASLSLWSKLITVLGHCVLALILWNRARSIDLTTKTEITSFYMFIWKADSKLLINILKRAATHGVLKESFDDTKGQRYSFIKNPW